MTSNPETSSSPNTNREVRRKILVQLYKTYEQDPHAVLTALELEQSAELTRDQILRNVFYLEERGFVECMKRYGSRLFAAVLITPEGIDLVEDPARLAALFGILVDGSADAGDTSVSSVDWAGAVREMYVAVCKASLDTEMRHAVLDDVRSLEFEMRRPGSRRRPQKIKCLLDWIEQALADNHLREIDLLRGITRHWEKDPG